MVGIFNLFCFPSCRKRLIGIFLVSSAGHGQFELSTATTNSISVAKPQYEQRLHQQLHLRQRDTNIVANVSIVTAAAAAVRE